MRLVEALRGIEPGNVAKVLVGGEKLEREDARLLVAEVHRAMRGAALRRSLFRAPGVSPGGVPLRTYN